MTPEQIQAAVANAIDRDRARLLEDRYHASTNGLLGAVRFADTLGRALPRLGVHSSVCTGGRETCPRLA